MEVEREMVPKEDSLSDRELEGASGRWRSGRERWGKGQPDTGLLGPSVLPQSCGLASVGMSDPLLAIRRRKAQ